MGTNYTPFLKLKANEVAAIASLSNQVSESVVPFFDLPIKKGMSSVSFCSMVEKAAKKIEKYLGKDRQFYLDNFDIPDSIQVHGEPNISFVINKFEATKFAPVVGLNRTRAHNDAVFHAKKSGLISSSRVAVRLVAEEFDDFDLIEDELAEIMHSATAIFEERVFILDCRLCLNADCEELSNKIYEFLIRATQTFQLTEMIVTGSSIPASISEIVKVDQESEHPRVELKIFDLLLEKGRIESLGFGDYTVVSPLYSEVSLPPEMMLNVTVPKILYPHGSVYYISRGEGALKGHVRGNLQYNDMLSDIVRMSFYRGESYSTGDRFFAEKARGIGKMVTPGSILNPTINAHITYMATDHPLFA